MEQAEKLGPYAGQARDQAAQKIIQARGWTAPRLEAAAQQVEKTVAPRVAGALTAAAQRVSPRPARRGLLGMRRAGLRIPRGAVVGSAVVVGGVLVYSLIRMRQASQDAEWQEHLDRAREQVRETRENLEDKASETVAKAADTAETATGKVKEKVRSTSGDRSQENGKADL
nr:hypothetical protein [Nocardiopsis algeriensis]